MPVPTSRNPHETRAQLAAWLADAIPQAEAVEVTLVASPRSTGYSCETVLFDASWLERGDRKRGAFAARVHPSGYSLFLEHDLDMQWRIMDALGRLTEVPVPRIIGHQTEGKSHLGQPFFVMERVLGDAPADSPPYSVKGWLAEASPRDQRVLYERALGVLARIDTLDWRGLGLDFLEASTSRAGIRRQVESHEGFLAWVADGRSLPVFEDAFAWLRANLPSDPALALNWGDARIGNILFRDFAPVAVLDWEMASLGPPETDLAWWLVFNQIHTTGRGTPNLAGFPSDAEVIDLYEERTGLTVRNLRYYQVWAAFRAALLLFRFNDMLVRSGVLQPGAAKAPHVPAVNVMTALLAQ
jgi:aminoglycoside phosphotransferase (APT) family kinase protein